MEIHQKKAGPDNHRLKTMMKRSIEQAPCVGSKRFRVCRQNARMLNPFQLPNPHEPRRQRSLSTVDG